MFGGRGSSRCGRGWSMRSMSSNSALVRCRARSMTHRATWSPRRPGRVLPRMMAMRGMLGLLWVSGVDLGAGAAVEAQGLQDAEGCGVGEGLHVCGCEDAGVLGDHGFGRACGHLVEVALYAGPHVRAVVHEVRRRVDRAERGL